MLVACGGGGNAPSHLAKAPDDGQIRVDGGGVRTGEGGDADCPGGQKDAGQCTATGVEVRCLPAVAAPTTTGEVDWRWIRDRRSGWGMAHGPRLDMEIRQLEVMLRAMDLGSKIRPGLLRRLAEDYVESEHEALREKAEAEMKGDAFKKCDPVEAERQQAIATSRQLKVDASQKQAIDHYTALVTDYSGRSSTHFPQNQPEAYPLLDQAYYYLAYEYEQAGDLANARRVYLDLIAKTPGSPFISLSYLAFGEWFSKGAISDPTKWEPAKQAYLKVIAGPPAHFFLGQTRPDAAFGYAWLRLGQIAEHRQERSQARAAFIKVIEFATNFPSVPGATPLKAQVPDWVRQSPDAQADAGADG